MEHITITNLLQWIATGLAIGCIYAMVAVGFNIIYNATGIINLAQGEFVMLGSLITVSAYDNWGFPLPLAVLAAVVIVGAVGVGFERIAIRPVRKPTVLILIIITIAGSYFFRGAALNIWGEGVYKIGQFFGETPIRLGGVTIRNQVPVIFVALIFVAVALGLFFGRTMTGKAMRASSYNRTAARLVGVNPGNMVMLAFGISAGIAGLAGAVMVPITQAQYDSGPMLALKGFAAAVLGGLGNNVAAVVAGLLLGVLEELSSGCISSSYKDPIALGLMLVVLFFRPSGLFGRKDLSKLSEF